MYTHSTSKVRPCVHMHMCLCQGVPPLLLPSPIHIPPRTLIHAGGDVKNLVVSVYLLYLSLLSVRNKSHVGDAA